MLDETVVPRPLLPYKNTSRLARGDDVRRCRALYVRKLIRMLPEPVRRRMWLIRRGFVVRVAFLVARAFLGRARYVRAFGGKKERGRPSPPVVRTLLQVYLWSIKIRDGQRTAVVRVCCSDRPSHTLPGFLTRRTPRRSRRDL